MPGKIVVHEDPLSDALMFEVANSFRSYGRAAELVSLFCGAAETERERDKLRESASTLRTALRVIRESCTNSDDIEKMRSEMREIVGIVGRALDATKEV